MPNVFALNALLFALPFLVYAAFLFATRGKAGDPADWSASRVILLSVVGFALLAGGLFFFVSFRQGEPGTTYHPTEIRDGKIVPGGFEQPGGK